MSGATETLKHMEAFEYYYALGNNRTLKQVAQHFNVAEGTVSSWSRSFNWQKRIIARDVDAGRRLRERNILSVDDEIGQYKKIIKASVATYVDELKSGRLKITDVKDFVQLVNLDLRLSDGGNTKESTSDETSNTIKQLYESVKAYINEDDGDV